MDDAGKEDPRLALATLFERVVSLTDKVNAAHRRVDDLEGDLKDSIWELKSDIKEFSTELKTVNHWMHRAIGWGSAAIFLSGLLGAGVGKAVVMAVTRG